MRLHSVHVLTVLLLGVTGLFAQIAAAAPPPAGGLVQLAPPSACFSSTAGGGCSGLDGGFILGANGLASTPDGRNVYAVGTNGGGATFDRGPGGVLRSMPTTPLGAVLAASPDGTGLAAGHGSSGQSLGSVNTYTRDPQTGALGLGVEVADSCGLNPCASDNGLYDVQGVAYSPDGKSLYAASHNGGGGARGAVTAFARNPSTQGISLIQCVPNVLTASGPCSTGPAAEGIAGAEGLVVSPDGLFVYVASRFDSAVVGFNRVTAGVGLAKLGAAANCLTGGPTTNACANTPGLTGAAGLAISPDGRDVYVASFNDGVAVLRRNVVSGVLTFTECLKPVAAGGCSGDPGLVTGARSIAVSPDGRSVYVAGGNGATGYLRAYGRDTASGRLTSLNCLTNLGSAPCDTAAGLKNASSVSVSPDSRNVYATSFLGGDGSGAVAAFSVATAPSCSSAAVATGYGAAAQLPLTCLDVDGDPLTRSIATQPQHGTLGAIDQVAGTVAYLPDAGYAGPDTVGFAATDGTNVAAAASVAVTVGSAAPSGPDIGPGPVPGPVPGPPAPRPKAIRLTVKPIARQRTTGAAARGLRIRATCVPGCVLRLTLQIPRAEAKRLHLGRRAVRAAASRTRLRAGKPTTIALKLGKRPKAALQRASRVRFALTATATAAGATSTTRRVAVGLRR
ncbi:MAG TPA: beta-propeller fold lactonase family protein [Conexibacter sp.]|jgi:6-phosphogluconolactonase (cycloisomerase 2 family)